MQKEVSFKTRVKETAIIYAKEYQSYYVNKEYLLISDALCSYKFCIIKAEKDNYLHLLGITTRFSASVFFDKCYQGTLEECDFEIVSHGQDSSSSKGSIRRKINALPYIFDLMGSNSFVEENFRKNSVSCSVASSNGLCTLGFVLTPYARPKTLIKGNELDEAKRKPIKVLLSKDRAEHNYNQVIVGSTSDILENYEIIKGYIGENLYRKLFSNNISN